MATALVGRSAELAAVTEAIEQVGRGVARALFVSGDSGTGKTTLLQRAVDDAGRSGFHVAEVRVRGDDAPLSALRAAVLRSGARPGSGVDDLRAAMAGRAQHGPVLLAVDDLHAADGATRAAVPYLVRHLRRHPVLVFATYTEDQLGDRLGEQLMRLADARRVEEIRLGRFTAADLADLVAVRTGSEPHAHFVDVLLERSGGLPFFAVELLDVLLGAGADPSSPLAADRISDLVLPRRVSTAVLHRVFELGSDARRVASAASVLGRARLDRLPHLVELTGLAATRVNDAFDRLVKARVLVVDAAEFHFRHSLVREAVYSDLDASVRRSFHAKAAMRLALERSAARPHDILEVASHLRRAGGGRDTHAAHLFREAGDLVLHDDPSAAAAWYEDALARLGPMSPEIHEIQLSLGQSLDLVGRHDEAARVTAAALRRLGPGPDRDRGSSIAANAAFAAGRFELAGLFLDAAIERGARPPALLLQRGWIRLWQGRLAASAADLASARSLGVGRSGAVADALEMHLSFNRGGARHGAALADRLRLRLPSLHDDVRTSVETAVRIVDAFELDPARAVLDESTTSTTVDRSRTGTEPSVQHRAYSAYALLRGGHLSEALAAADAVADTLGNDGADLARSVIFAVQISARAEQGDLIGAEAAHQRARTTHPLVMPFLVDCAVARLHVLRAEQVTAVAVLREAVRRESEIGRVNVLAMTLAAMVETAVDAGDLDEARSANDRLHALPFEDASVAMAMWRLRSRALAESDEGAARLGRAHASRHGLALDAARMLLVLGDLTLDPATLTAAAGELEALGAVGLHQDATIALRHLGARSPHGAQRSRGLTSDDRRIVGLVAEGLTNRQIAQRMHLSPKTIEVYLSRIYARTGRRSRVELAVAVQRNELDGVDGGRGRLGGRAS